MLTQMRGALKGVVAWFVIILLILAFALWGVPNITQMTSSAAVTVGEERFSSQYVQNEFNRAFQLRRQQSSGEFSREEALATGFTDQVVESIATTSALAQFTERMGLAMPREIVAGFLQENENFQNPATGQFDRFVLESLLQRNNMSVEEFEGRVAEDLMRNQLIGALGGAGPAPSQLSEAMLLRMSERRRIAYLTVTDEMSGAPAEPGPEDLETYYQENLQASFTAPEYRAFDMLVLDREAFAEEITVDEEELRRIYDLNRERLYEQPERRTIYQITFDTDTEAQAAVAALRQGTPFETIAIDNGTTLEAVTFADAQARDILDPSVSEAAFAEGLGEGDILDPVQSLFGWTAVQIAGVTPPEVQTFEDVRADIEADLLNNDLRRAMLDAIDVIEEERDTGANLAAAAQEAGFETERVGPVDRFSFAPGGGDGAAAIVDGVPGEALAQVFRLEEGDESEAIELGDNEGYVFVSLQEITAPTPYGFEDVRDEVERGWRNQERAQRISATVRSLREAVEGGQTLEEAAATLDRAPIEIVIDRRFQNEVVSQAFNEQVFFADPGSLVSGPTALGEAQVVAEVRTISYTRNAIAPNEENLQRQYLGFQLDQELLEAFVTEVREDYGVEINRAQLNTLYTDG